MAQHRKIFSLVLSVISIMVVILSIYGCSASSEDTGSQNVDKDTQQQESGLGKNPVGQTEVQDSRPGLEGGLGRNILDQAVAAEIITQEQADEIMVLMEEDGVMLGEGMTNVLDDAVTAGTIAQNEADEITKLMEENRESLPESDMKAPGFGENMPNFDRNSGTGMFGGAVEEGIITEEEADELMEFVMNSGGPMGGNIGGVFEEAVIEGTITQEQADILAEFMESVGRPMGQGRPAR